MATGRFSGSAWANTSVDAKTAFNNVNKNNESDYFCILINGILKSLDYIASDGTIKKCISLAKYCINIVRSSTSSDTSSVTNNDEIVPDSGVTLHMRKNISVFENDYVACTNVFVLMGDQIEIPVLGYGTLRMKIDGHVTGLIKNLHVPGLDCDLFSCNQHGRNSKGCSLFLDDSKMYLTFLKFIISYDIPVNGDLRIQLDFLTDEDWEIPNALGEGTPIHNQDLDHFGTRLDMVNEILRGRIMTRAQKRIQLDRLKQALDQNTREGLLNNNSSNSCDNFDATHILFLANNNLTRNSSSKDRSNHDFDGLPDNYSCGDLPDKMLMEVLKELNSSDIKDFLTMIHPNPSKNQNVPHHLNIT